MAIVKISSTHTARGRSRPSSFQGHDEALKQRASKIKSSFHMSRDNDHTSLKWNFCCQWVGEGGDLIVWEKVSRLHKSKKVGNHYTKWQKVQQRSVSTFCHRLYYTRIRALRSIKKKAQTSHQVNNLWLHWDIIVIILLEIYIKINFGWPFLSGGMPLSSYNVK